ncbi:hypothetical protein E5083_19625 [Streptomyces bauhiniae]|uniref:Uncharacterized protein n=1 Tax=Streptomyces bauhiniae TaxID=2340725 RepID=A0A4Z1D3H8_9ACTN|nr:hypothetical protein E5083_19625 [Streptomyces bauhiniae]
MSSMFPCVLFRVMERILPLLEPYAYTCRGSTDGHRRLSDSPATLRPEVTRMFAPPRRTSPRRGRP